MSTKVQEARKRKIKVYLLKYIDDFDLIEYTTKLEKELTKIVKPISNTNYNIHDNGGVPFKVYVNAGKNQFEVYKHGNNYYDGFDQFTQQVIKPTKYIKIFIGSDSTVKGSKGNSILVKLTNKKYMYIGSEIYTFETADEIIAYKSPIGNSDVPYPYALSKTNIYFMLREKYCPRDIINEKQQYYKYYYIEHSAVKSFRKKQIIKRVWS